MSDPLFNTSLGDIRREINVGLAECSRRGLMHSAKWLAELKLGIVLPSGCESNVFSSTSSPKKRFIPQIAPIPDNEVDKYDVCKALFDLREYDRAAFYVENSKSPVARFMHFYCSYMAKEKRRLDNLTDHANLTETNSKRDLTDLLGTLRALYSQRKLDAYCLYLYGVVLKKLDLKDMAIPVLVESVNAAPTLWASWIELAPLIMSKEELMSLALPNHWMKSIFIAHTHIELFLNDEGLELFEELKNAGFQQSVYITSQIAIAYHNKRNVEKAIQIFQYLQNIDPYRLDNLDTFSNLLFVKEMKKEMASLAHKAVEINKYRPETCCVIGNYYSIRADHTKAVKYFQRALKLNPQYLSAWTLMGHEFMEMKNTNAAIQSYRKAVEVNRRDYRAWYGLGQSYEILKMPYYSLYYYKISQQLRPYDSRMLVALGETYEKLDKFDNALKCYQKACNVGDIEGITLLRLGNLYEKLDNIDAAVLAYMEFTKDERAVIDKAALCRAFITLGNYFESNGKYDEASHYAYKCLAYDEIKTEAQALLNTIRNKRTLVLPTTISEPTRLEVDDDGDADMSIDTSVGRTRDAIVEVNMDAEDAVTLGDDAEEEEEEQSTDSDLEE